PQKTGLVGEKMEQLLLAYQQQDKNDIYATRTAALAGLPIYLKEDSSDIFKTCKDEMEKVQLLWLLMWMKRRCLQEFLSHHAKCSSCLRIRL
ncbi:hypothetical protein CHARACLAT_015116, partial [Characodon lateralis]|nr:hypothetical protein [Characodon lateralis]